MSEKLINLVSFDIERLFNGAIDVDWLMTDVDKAKQAASAFVFHGPTYHGVSQKDVSETGHRLIDSASFVAQTICGLNGMKGNPFVLAIAGFGSGKSHLAVTLSELLSTHDASFKKRIIDNIAQADAGIAREIQHELSKLDGNVLVLTLNGMNNCDLSSALLAQIKEKVSQAGLSLEPLENLRKRFKHAANILQNMDISLMGALFEAVSVTNKEELIVRLEGFDEGVYKNVYMFLQSVGIPLNVIGDETAKDILNVVADAFVGEDKPFKKLLILFDEFGHYMEFATSHPQISGDGALQHLFEGIQNNDSKVSFIGFIQYELKAYEQRLPSEFKNEVRRFITRFDTASKLYLSSNLETLIASLLVKKTTKKLGDDRDLEIQKRINSWYPVSNNFSVWANPEMFSRVIVEGCWPLSPLAMWVLFHLSSIGQYLQQRSALTLLKSALAANDDFEVSPSSSALPPVALWTKELQQEFEGIEEELARGSIMQSYNSVLEKNGQHISKDELTILRSIVLLAQTRLLAKDKADAWLALKAFSGFSTEVLSSAISILEDEKNVIAWDETFKQYEILSDSVSRAQFIRILRQKAQQEYDEERKARLFISGAQLLPLLLPKVECDFANENNITTPEWVFQDRPTYWKMFKLTIVTYVTQLQAANEFMPIDEPRGLMIYCYVPNSESAEIVKDEAQRILKARAGKLPIILALLFDDANSTIAKTLVDLDILSNMSAEEKDKYSRLIASHTKKQMELLESAVKQSLLMRNYLTASAIPAGRLATMGNSLFQKLFPRVLQFQFDGYATGRGNAARDCVDFTRKLLTTQFRFDDTQTMPPQQRNRAQTVLNTNWKIFGRDGSVTLKQPSPVVKAIVLAWDQQLVAAEGLNCAHAIRIACGAPYGANLPAAGLLFAAFMQARQNGISVVKNGERVSFGNESDNLFNGQVLDVSYLKEFSLHKSEEGNSEWDQLMSDWGNCSSYTELCEFLEKKDSLRERLPIPPLLRGSIEQLTRQSEEAQRKIEEADQRESIAISKIQNGIQMQKVSVMTWGASLLVSCVRRKAEDTMWNQQEDIMPMVDQINEAKQHIIQGFPAWLPTNRPNGIRLESLSDFKTFMIDRVASNLKNLDLIEQRDAVIKHVDGIAHSFEAILDAQQKITNADNWLANNADFSKDATVVQLDIAQSAIEKQSELLKNCRTTMKRIRQEQFVGELTNRIDQMDETLTAIERIKKEIDKRAKVVWNTKLTIDSANTILNEIADLVRLYAGSIADVDDFRMMRSVLNDFIDALRKLDNLQLPSDEYAVQVKNTRDSFMSKFVDEEPPWDLEETFDGMIKVLNHRRTLASQEWLRRMEEKYGNIESLSLQEGDEGLRFLSFFPPYFDVKKSGKKIESLKKNIEKHLESKGVEWLYGKYLQLSSNAKKIFLELLKK